MITHRLKSLGFPITNTRKLPDYKADAKRIEKAILKGERREPGLHR